MSDTNPYLPTNDEIIDIEKYIDISLNGTDNNVISNKNRVLMNISVIVDRYKATKPDDDLIIQSRMKYTE